MLCTGKKLLHLYFILFYEKNYSNPETLPHKFIKYPNILSQMSKRVYRGFKYRAELASMGLCLHAYKTNRNK